MLKIRDEVFYFRSVVQDEAVEKCLTENYNFVYL